MIKPVRPDEIVFALSQTAIAAINNQLTKGLTFTIVDLNLDEPIDPSIVKLTYEQVGWSVTVDRPGYNETYPTTFYFKRK